MKKDSSLFPGLIIGVVLTLSILAFMKSSGVVESSGRDVIAKVGSQNLTRSEAKSLIAEDFIAIENDEYALLEGIANQWLSKSVLEKEAESKGLSVEEYLAKEVWSEVATKTGNMQGQIRKAKEERLENYETARAQAVEQLKKKYHAKVFLKKPKTYVPGLAIVSKSSSGWKDEVRKGTSASPTPGTNSPTVGPEDAPVKIVEYADFHCGFCKRAHRTTQQVLDNYGDKVQLVFKHYPLSNSPGSGSYLTHEAATCAQEQGKFWEFHHKVMESSSSPARDDLNRFASELKLDSAKFKECLSSGRYRAIIKKDKDEGSADGVSGTPAFRVNGRKVDGAFPYDHFKGIIEGILDPSKAQPEPKNQRRPTPAKKTVFNDLNGKPSKGPENAAVTIVEFSDFHCPFCERVNPTIKQIMNNYKEKVRLVWRHYPLSFHVGAEVTHQASECARDQGEEKFWEAHDMFFENVGGYRNNDDYKKVAEKIGLDSSQFIECIDSKKYAEKIQKDIRKANEVGVSGTPAFFINGENISGAQPYSVFKAAIERALDPTKANEPVPAPTPKKPKKVEFDDLDGKPTLGPKNAAVTIVEFSDFHCPFCVRVGPSLQKLMDNYSGKIRRVWRHFPLSMHRGADLTHEASECANEQGKFWEFKKKVFENISSEKSSQALLGFAKDLGLNEKQFQKCVDSRKYQSVVQADIQKGNEVGVRGTPAIFINGQFFAGAYPYEVFEEVVKKELDS